MLIVSEQKSIGREAFETNFVIKQLAQAGVEVFEYVHGQSLTPRNYIDKMMSAFRAGADEAHREQTSERVHESHARSARAGHVVGGRVFGYRNRDVFAGVDVHGRPLKSHTERVIDPTEAAVVRRIFALYDAGEGLKRIAMQLNREGAAPPKPFVRKDPTKVLPQPGWSPSTVRAILQRELYRGVIVWNRTRKRPATWGHVNQQPRPQSDWLRIPADHLRIIDEALWARVQARREEAETLAARLAGGRLAGRPPKTPTNNLLAGLATCAQCGGGFVVETSRRKRGRVPEYVCFRRRAHGTCTNAFRMNVGELNEAVLQAVEEHALTPEAIERVIHLSERDDVAERQMMLARERQDIEKRKARLVDAIECGGDAPSLVAKLREHEARLRAIDAEIASLRPVSRVPPAVIDSRLAEWRRLLRSSTTQGRAVLQRILRGRIVFTPHVNPISGAVDGYDFQAPTRFDKLFTGLAAMRPKGLEESKDGCENIGPEDTFDAAYARVLERAYEEAERRKAKQPAKGKRVKVLASPTGTALSWLRDFSTIAA